MPLTLPTGLVVYTTWIGVIRKERSDCNRVRLLFDTLKLQYVDIDVGFIPCLRAKLASISGLDCVPQVYVGDTFVGTYDQLQELHDDGKMISRLKEAGYTEQPNFKKLHVFSPEDYIDEDVDEGEEEEWEEEEEEEEQEQEEQDDSVNSPEDLVTNEQTPFSNAPELVDVQGTVSITDIEPQKQESNDELNNSCNSKLSDGERPKGASRRNSRAVISSQVDCFPVPSVGSRTSSPTLRTIKREPSMSKSFRTKSFRRQHSMNRPPRLGLQVIDMDRNKKTVLHVSAVQKDGLFSHSGIKPGDILLTWNGWGLNNVMDLALCYARMADSPGETIKVWVERSINLNLPQASPNTKKKAIRLGASVLETPFNPAFHYFEEPVISIETNIPSLGATTSAVAAAIQQHQLNDITVTQKLESLLPLKSSPWRKSKTTPKNKTAPPDLHKPTESPQRIVLEIGAVAQGSLLDTAGVSPGDVLVSLEGSSIASVDDYAIKSSDLTEKTESISLVIRRLLTIIPPLANSFNISAPMLPNG